MRAKRKIEIRKVSCVGLWITLLLALAFVFLIIQGENEFFALNESTEQYIQAEKAVQQFEKGADYLTEQVKMHVMTGDTSYMDAYFVEANQVKSRENALDTFKTYFDKTASFSSLKAALDTSLELMTTEYYAMRLVCEANDVLQSSWPDEIKAVELSKEDEKLSDDDRNIDYVCRIGGDEFAVIMVNSASDKRCTIQKKIEDANEELSNPTDSLPAVSLSVGVAFSDRKNPKGSISNDADTALYYIKEHGRHNCGFY